MRIFLRDQHDKKMDFASVFDVNDAPAEAMLLLAKVGYLYPGSLLIFDDDRPGQEPDALMTLTAGHVQSLAPRLDHQAGIIELSQPLSAQDLRTARPQGRLDRKNQHHDRLTSMSGIDYLPGVMPGFFCRYEGCDIDGAINLTFARRKRMQGCTANRASPRTRDLAGQRSAGAHATDVPHLIEAGGIVTTVSCAEWRSVFLWPGRSISDRGPAFGEQC